MKIYNPKSWFWVVNGDDGRAWSSESRSYVSSDDQRFIDFGGPDAATRVRSESDIHSALEAHGLSRLAPVSTLSASDYEIAIQTHIDATAAQRGYVNGLSAASYINSNIASWALEASKFITWRDSVWGYAHEQVFLIQSGQAEKPTIDSLINGLPPIEW